MPGFRKHLTYANVTATLALVIALGGGAAYAANTIGSSDIIDESIQSVDLKNGQVRTADVVNDGLTGADIKDNSGVDTCPSPATLRFGPICAGSDGSYRTWSAASNYCTGLGLRLPSLGEAKALGTNYDVPGVGVNYYFWTDDKFFKAPDGFVVQTVNEDGSDDTLTVDSLDATVCVTDPTN